MEPTSLRVVLDTPTVREKTIEVLREAILNQYFKPGQNLVERAVCNETGVSRTSVREALSQLEAEGLVIRVPNKGMFVARVGREEARQIYEMRGIIEAAMARLFVARAREEDLALLESALARAEETIFSDNAIAHAQALDGFSDAIIRGAGNDVARQMSAVLRARVTYLRTITTRSATPERRRGTVEMLHHIVDAFRARDADRAEQLSRAYVERSATFARDVLTEQEEAEAQP
jgi:DNA-binding GntR family transcriptional regulator